MAGNRQYYSVMAFVLVGLFVAWIFFSLVQEESATQPRRLAEVKPVFRDCHEVCSEADKVCRQGCRDAEVYGSAIGALDPDLCGLIKEEHMMVACVDQVIYQQAVSRQDAGLCQKIFDKDSRMRCIGSVVSRLACELDELGLCDTIPDLGLAETCRREYYTYMAMVNKEPGRCVRAGTAEESCLRFVIASLLTEGVECSSMQEYLEICTQIKLSLESFETPVQPKQRVRSCEESCDYSAAVCVLGCNDDSAYRLALSGENEYMCGQIMDSGQRTECLAELFTREAVRTREPDRCEQLQSQEHMVECRARVMGVLANAP